jgi:hypothetical protein
MIKIVTFQSYIIIKNRSYYNIRFFYFINLLIIIYCRHFIIPYALLLTIFTIGLKYFYIYDF